MLHYAALCFLDCIVFPYGLGWSWHYEALCCIMPEYYFVRVPLASPNLVHVPHYTNTNIDTDTDTDTEMIDRYPTCIGKDRDPHLETL